ncbi:MAG: putative signal transduction histidine kinase [Bacteroidetes bacterium]|nr:putative signal transduction histidine kinase [Bacteroidota bacterium]
MGVLILVSFVVLFVLFYQKKVLEQRTLIAATESNFQKTLLAASLEVAEQERAKVAANIHDDVGIILSVLKLKLNKAAKNPGNEEVAKGLLVESNKLIEETIQIIRNISNDLMPASLSNIGIISAFIDMCDRLDDADMIEVKFESNVDEVEMDKKRQVQLYRLVKEILNNVIKHSKASKISVGANVNNHILVTTIEHNGVGVTSEQIKKFTDESKGLGLKSIVARAQLINAKVDYLVSSSTPRIVIETTLV